MIAITKNDTRSINAALLGLDKELKKIKTKLGISDTYNTYNSTTNNTYDYTVNNGAIATVSGAAVTVDIDNFELEEGAVVHIICPAMSTASPTLNVSSTGAIAIKAVRNGSLITPAVHSGKWGGASSYTNRVWDANTALTLMYNGTYWVIMGNPVFCSYFSSSQSYEIQSNGLIRQWGYIYYGSLSAGGSWAFDIEFLVAYTSTAYRIMITAAGNQGGQEERYDPGRTVSTISGHVYNRNSGTTITGLAVDWVCIGY